MPFKSQAQAKFFFAAANKKNGLPGLDKNTAKAFIKDAPKQSIKNLPMHAQQTKKQKFPKLQNYFKPKAY